MCEIVVIDLVNSRRRRTALLLMLVVVRERTRRGVDAAADPRGDFLLFVGSCEQPTGDAEVCRAPLSEQDRIPLGCAYPRGVAGAAGVRARTRPRPLLHERWVCELAAMRAPMMLEGTAHIALRPAYYTEAKEVSGSAPLATLWLVCVLWCECARPI